MEEIWEDIENCDGRYQVSNMGQVRSIIHGEYNLLKPCNDRGEYRVSLHWHEQKVKHYVKNLVYKTFKGNIEGERLYHINGDKSDNRLDNLAIKVCSNNKNNDTIQKKGIIKWVDFYNRNINKII